MAIGLHGAWSLEFSVMMLGFNDYRSSRLRRDILQEKSGSVIDAGVDTPKWREW